MIRAGVGLSTDEDTERAAQEATATALDRAGLETADWLLVFATSVHRPSYSRMLGVVSSEARSSNLVGCSGIGVLTSDGEIEGGPGIAVLAVASDTMSATPLLLRGLADYADFATAATGTVDRTSARASDLVLLLPDPVQIQLDGLTRVLEAAHGSVPMVGAAPSEDGTLGATFEFCGEEIVSGGIAGLRLRGEFVHTVRITQACQPLAEPCIVTRSAGSLLYQVDGRPALTVLLEQIPSLLSDNLPRALAYVAVGIVPIVGDAVRRGEYIVRNIVGVDPERGAIRIAGRVADGQSVYFTLLEADRARDDLKTMLESVSTASSGRTYRFGLYFNCAARGTSLYRIPGVDTAFLGAALRGTPIIGFFGNAELAPMAGTNHVLTYTGVLALISEPA